METCVSCRHEWATDFATLPAETKQKVDAVPQDH
jgi:hypothetical protein